MMIIQIVKCICLFYTKFVWMTMLKRKVGVCNTSLLEVWEAIKYALSLCMWTQTCIYKAYIKKFLSA